MTKIYLDIPDNEFVKLARIAFTNSRCPRDQLHHFLRQCLGIVPADNTADIDDLRKRIERLEELVDALSIPMPTVYGGKDG